MVRARVTGMASSTTPDSRQPRNSAIRTGHGKSGQQQMLQQFVGLGFGGRTVISRRCHRHVGGNGHCCASLQLASAQRSRDVGRIGALALGNRNRHCGIFLCAASLRAHWPKSSRTKRNRAVLRDHQQFCPPHPARATWMPYRQPQAQRRQGRSCLLQKVPVSTRISRSPSANSPAWVRAFAAFSRSTTMSGEMSKADNFAVLSTTRIARV